MSTVLCVAPGLWLISPDVRLHGTVLLGYTCSSVRVFSFCMLQILQGGHDKANARGGRDPTASC
eukprot:m.1290884 g.1290884  ORF g.1290884 m.1290884 type:complete len:64 (-) comp24784_c0_seq28:1671-1862(-)